jgi:hypothetical protein
LEVYDLEKFLGERPMLVASAKLKSYSAAPLMALAKGVWRTKIPNITILAELWNQFTR